MDGEPGLLSGDFAEDFLLAGEDDLALSGDFGVLGLPLSAGEPGAESGSLSRDDDLLLADCCLPWLLAGESGLLFGDCDRLTDEEDLLLDLELGGLLSLSFPKEASLESSDSIVCFATENDFC